MTVLDLMEKAARAAYDAERWAVSSPGLAWIRRRDARILTAMARELVERNRHALAA